MSFEPEIVVLYCQHCADADAEPAIAAQRAEGLVVRPTMMPCSSKVEVPHLLKILEQGADAVQVVACPEGKCRFLVGSLRAERRIDYARGLLEQIGFDGERLGISRHQRLSAEEILRLAEDRARAVKPLGPSPMKKGEERRA